jgi:hypothetical protein
MIFRKDMAHATAEETESEKAEAKVFEASPRAGQAEEAALPGQTGSKREQA